MTNKLISLGKILMIIGLIVCLFDMPYGYYQLVRFVGMSFFGFLAISYYKNSQNNWMYFYASIAILLNPFIKIALGKNIWNIIDIIISLIIIGNIISERVNQKNI